MNNDDRELAEEEIDTDPGDEAPDDIVMEDNTEVTGADYKVKTDKLRARIKELEKKNAELLDAWQRDKADFVNARNNDEVGKQQFMKFAKADIIAEILPVLDSFESAFKNKDAWEKVDKNWRQGVEYIQSQLYNVLSSHGLESINPMGERYDYTRDESVDTVKVDSERDDGKILDVVQIGYKLNGKEIRAPKVKVGHYNADN